MNSNIAEDQELLVVRALPLTLTKKQYGSIKHHLHAVNKFVSLLFNY